MHASPSRNVPNEFCPATSPTRIAKTCAPPLAHVPQLDGLRALAIGLVLLAHFGPSFGRWLPGGNAGVRLFFVLSGYLITGILLRERSREGASYSQVLRGFYARRALRILPVYGLALFAAAMLGFVERPW